MKFGNSVVCHHRTNNGKNEKEGNSTELEKKEQHFKKKKSKTTYTFFQLSIFPEILSHNQYHMLRTSWLKIQAANMQLNGVQNTLSLMIRTARAVKAMY